MRVPKAVQELLQGRLNIKRRRLVLDTVGEYLPLGPSEDMGPLTFVLVPFCVGQKQMLADTHLNHY